jgi:Protein of unknown function (DUF4012)
MPRSRSHPTEVVARPPEGGTTRRRKRSRWRRLWHRFRWPMLALGVLVVIAVIDGLVRYLPAVQALQHGRNDVAQAQTLLTGDIAHLDQRRVAQARSLLADAELDFGSRSAVLADGWIGGVADSLPWIGSQVSAARLLRTAGEDGTVAATNIVGLVEQLVPSGTTAQLPLLQRLVTVAQDHKGDLSTLSAQLATLQADIAALPNGRLLGPLDSARTTLRTQGSRVLATAGPAIALLQALPAAIGPGQHTYLLLLENPGEERPGGGFIGAVGQVTFTNGSITSQTFRDSAFSDPLVTNIPPPRPLRLYPHNTIPWHLDESNWSPDFPTTVADAERIYAAATGVHPDGVIGVDPVALAGILAITGPISVPPYPQVITASNALLEINYITNRARPGDPGKVFLPPFGQAMVGRLLHAPIGQIPATASSLATSARQKHIVLYFADSNLESLVRGANFDGGVRAPVGDSLEVLDANLSGTKGDLFVSRRFQLQVAVGGDGQAHDQLTLTYHDPVATSPADQALNPNSGGDYRDYIQVLIPETGQLDGISLSLNGGPAHQVSPEAVTYEFQRQDIAFFLIVPHGGSATVVFSYEGPFADISQTPETYSLNWERQNGALTWPVAVSVVMPRSRARAWSTDLSVDRSWSVTAPGS